MRVPLLDALGGKNAQQWTNLQMEVVIVCVNVNKFCSVRTTEIEIF